MNRTCCGIFLGIFFTVAAIIAGTVTLAAVRAYKDHVFMKHEAIQWMGDFHDLPQSARVCRHVLTTLLASVAIALTVVLLARGSP